MNFNLRWVHNQTKRILFWKYWDVLHICSHICKDVSLGLKPLCCDLKKSAATIIHQHVLRWQRPMLLNTTMNGMNRKLEEIVYNRWPLVTLLAGVCFTLLQFVLKYMWNVFCQQQFSPNLLHSNSPPISFSLKTYLLVSLLSVLTLGAVWGKSSALKYYCFLVMWIKGDSKRVLTVRHAWRRCAPTQFFHIIKQFQL